MVLPGLALVRRELITALRTPRVFLFVAAFVTIPVLYALVSWPSDPGNLRMASRISRGLMQSIGLGLFGGCLLFIPAYAASAIVIERQRATFDMLKITLIRPHSILFAKLLNALGLFALILVALLPVLALSSFLVGVDTGELLLVLIIVGVTAITCASIGLWCSARFRSAYAAIGASYVAIVGMMAIAPMVTFIGLSFFGVFFQIRAYSGFIEQAVLVGSPVGMMYYIASGIPAPQTVIIYIVTQCAIAAVLTFSTWRRLLKPDKSLKVQEEKPIDDHEQLAVRMKRFPYYIVDPLKRKKPIEDGRNPMMLREIRWGLMNRGTVMVRIFYCTFVVYFFVGASALAARSNWEVLTDWFWAQIVITVLAAPALMANALTKEYELGNLDMLRMTLLRPKDIVIGKLAAGVGALIPVLLAAALSSIPIMIAGRDDFDAMGLVTLVVSAFISLGIGLASSMMTNRTSAALGISYVLTIIVFGGAAALFEWIRDAQDFAFSEAVTQFVSPLTAFMHSVPAARDAVKEVHYTYWATNITVFAAMGVALVAGSVWAFSTYKMRDR